MATPSSPPMPAASGAPPAASISTAMPAAEDARATDTASVDVSCCSPPRFQHIPAAAVAENNLVLLVLAAKMLTGPSPTLERVARGQLQTFFEPVSNHRRRLHDHDVIDALTMSVWPREVRDAAVVAALRSLPGTMRVQEDVLRAFSASGGAGPLDDSAGSARGGGAVGGDGTPRVAIAEPVAAEAINSAAVRWLMRSERGPADAGTWHLACRCCGKWLWAGRAEADPASAVLFSDVGDEERPALHREVQWHLMNHLALAFLDYSECAAHRLRLSSVLASERCLPCTAVSHPSPHVRECVLALLSLQMVAWCCPATWLSAGTRSADRVTITIPSTATSSQHCPPTRASQVQAGGNGVCRRFHVSVYVYDVGSTSRFSGRLPQPHLSPLDWWPVTAGTFTLPTACGDGAQPAAPRTQVQPQPPAVYSIVLPESLATRPIDGIGAGSAPCVVLPSYVGADGVRMWRLLMPKGTDLRSTQWAMLLQVRVQVAALTGDGQSVMSTNNVVARTAVFLPSVLHARSSRR